MVLENYEAISNEETLANELDKAISGFKTEAKFVANEAIKGLDEKNLTTFIEKSFKNDNSERLTYSEMKQNSFYGFMVQSAIDLLSDKLASDGRENKYDKDGRIDENGKTLDNWIRESGGIDNIYGSGTRNIVKMVQHILGIHEDGFAGPQFFAKVCSVLKGENAVSEFKVKGYDGNSKKYRYSFDNYNDDKNGKTDSGGDITETKDNTIIDGIDENDHKALESIFNNINDNDGYLKFVLKDSQGNIKKNGNDIIVYSVSDNNEFYYVWNSRYDASNKTYYAGTSEDYTRDGLYSLVKKNLDCGKFDSLFSKGYEDLQGEDAQTILNKTSDERTAVDYQKLGSIFSNTWTGGGNLQRLGARLCTESNDGSGGKNFLNWCEGMKKGGLSTKKLTIRNWFALTKMGCSITDNNFIEGSQFNKSKES